MSLQKVLCTAGVIPTFPTGTKATSNHSSSKCNINDITVTSDGNKWGSPLLRLSSLASQVFTVSELEKKKRVCQQGISMKGEGHKNHPCFDPHASAMPTNRIRKGRIHSDAGFLTGT